MAVGVDRMAGDQCGDCRTAWIPAGASTAERSGRGLDSDLRPVALHRAHSSRRHAAGCILEANSSLWTDRASSTRHSAWVLAAGYSGELHYPAGFGHPADSANARRYTAAHLIRTTEPHQPGRG